MVKMCTPTTLWCQGQFLPPDPPRPYRFLLKGQKVRFKHKGWVILTDDPNEEHDLRRETDPCTDATTVGG